MSQRRFYFSSRKKVSSQKYDSLDDFLWVAYEKNSSGKCIIQKKAFGDLSQSYFTIEREVDNIVEMGVNSPNLFVIYEDSTLFAEIFSKTNPLTTTTQISIPAGANENPVDLIIGDYFYVLTPGDISGENAKIFKYNLSGVLQNTIDLQQSGDTVVNAVSMEIDDVDDIYVVTNTNPAKLIRVSEQSGGGYTFESNLIT